MRTPQTAQEAIASVSPRGYSGVSDPVLPGVAPNSSSFARASARMAAAASYAWVQGVHYRIAQHVLDSM